MTSRIGSVSILVLTAVVYAALPAGAHHAISAKFDDKKPLTLTGVVTLVDWKNPHVHVFMNVKDAKGVLNWAAEQQGHGHVIQFHNLQRLVAIFFNVIGISEHARVGMRNE